MPYANEHAARLRDPDSFVSIAQLWEKASEGLRAIGGRLKSDPGGGTVEQAIRFAASKWTVAAAKKWLADHDYKPILFEPASGGKASVPRQEQEPVVRSAFPFEVKADAIKDDGTFEGLASVFGNRDLVDDIVMPGAFAETLAAHRQAGSMPKMLWQHNRDEPIGAWTDMIEDGQGLRVKGRLILEVARAREVHALLKGRALDGLSIGYQRVRSETQEETGVRKLLAVKLLEVSIVTFPANELARVSAVKTVRDLERVLRDAGLSKSEAVAVALHGFRGLEERDAPEVDPTEIRAVADSLRVLTARITTK